MKFICYDCDFEFSDVTSLRPVCPLCFNKEYVDKIIKEELEREIDDRYSKTI